MDKKPSPPLFLERRSYRQRRMMDALRLLPLVGLGLWMVPLLWPAAEAEAATPVKMSQAITFVFCVWVGLIVCTALLWSRVAAVSSDADAGADAEASEPEKPAQPSEKTVL